MTHTLAKGQGQWSVTSKVRVETDGWMEATALHDSLMWKKKRDLFSLTLCSVPAHTTVKL